MNGRKGKPPRTPPSELENDADAGPDSGFDEETVNPHEPLPPLPPLWRGRRRMVLVGLALSSLVQALLVVGAALIGRALVDREISLSGAQSLALLVTVLLGVALLRRWQIVQAERLAQNYIAEVRLALFDTLATMSPMGRLKHSRGGVMLRFVGDAQALRVWVGFGIPGLVSAGIAWLALVGGLALLDAALAAVALVVGSLAGLGMLWTLPPLAKAVREARLRQAYISANVYDKLATLSVMQSAAQQGRERRRLQRQNERLAHAMALRAAAQGRHHFALDLALACLALSVIGLLLFDTQGAHSVQIPGTTGQLIGALGLIGLLGAPLRRIGRALEQRTSAQVARERIAEFLANAESQPAGAASNPKPADSSLRIVGWPLRARPGHALTRHAAAGQRIAVMGAAGSGKTALLETLARLRPLEDAGIWLGGVHFEDITPRRFSRCVSFVAPEMLLLRGTLAKNLRYRRSNTSLGELQAACQAAGWPQALDEMALERRVRDAGANFTGEERRSLVMARALVGKPQLLLIDDIEHCLTAPTVAALERLFAACPGTIVYSTHDRALAAGADEVWTLDDTEHAQIEKVVPLHLVNWKAPE